jgi:hypothetical protein
MERDRWRRPGDREGAKGLEAEGGDGAARGLKAVIVPAALWLRGQAREKSNARLERGDDRERSRTGERSENVRGKKKNPYYSCIVTSKLFFSSIYLLNYVI